MVQTSVESYQEEQRSLWGRLIQYAVLLVAGFFLAILATVAISGNSVHAASRSATLRPGGIALNNNAIAGGNRGGIALNNNAIAGGNRGGIALNNNAIAGRNRRGIALNNNAITGFRAA